jgi:methylthioribose-1-phosphate isomerase
MNPVHHTRTADSVRAIQWEQGHLRLLDQRKLPASFEYLTLDTAEAVAGAISDMVVRGAPAIGIAAAYGVVLAAIAAVRDYPGDWRQVLNEKIPVLMDSRPTAVNLRWALERMQRVIDHCRADPVAALQAEADAIYTEDIEANRRMGKTGAAFLRNAGAVLTHCNTGSLATGGFGTALGVIRTAWANNDINRVYAAETRPWLQGSRLTAWELHQDDIAVTLVADSACAWLMQSGKVSWVIVGADRIAANGDVANKIGTYSHAVNARHHGIGFMVVAPLATIDPATPSGDHIEIEQRRPSELLEFSGLRIAPEGVSAFNPVFDVTPAELVSVLVTERGAIEAPDREKISHLLR